MSFARDFDFGGRRALVTGAANGFGAEIAALLSEHGASLVLADREADPLRDMAGHWNAEYHIYDQADVASVDGLIEKCGRIDILINCAGILVAKPLLDTSMDEVRRLIDVDFIGVFQLI